MTAGETLRIVFFGTPSFAVPALNRLLASRHRIVAVVTQPDRPRGRGQHLTASPVKQVAAQSGIPLLQPTRLRDEHFLRALADLHADVGVVVAYGRILPDEVLAGPRLGMMNLHASILPAYRGAAPVPRAVMAGEHQTGVSIMRVVRELDAGPVLNAVRRSIDPDETSEDVDRDLARTGADLLVATLDQLASGDAREVAQDHARATYASKLTKEEGLIDWTRPAREIHNRIRALHPWPHAYTFHDGRRYVILRSRPEPARPSSLDMPGCVLDARSDRLVVRCGGGTALGLLEIQPEGRRAMDVREFLAGHRLQIGDRFRTSLGP
ncbi:MAG: methionyl-tRNA formyltransferase [Acidobacteria bacterium]|nr:methionyl-tRNA formyltransferase [Acidobacteriota bacterium]